MDVGRYRPLAPGSGLHDREHWSGHGLRGGGRSHRGSTVTVTWLALLGGLGALTRFELGGWVQRRTERPYPWGTLVVNAAGSFLLGLVSASPRLGSSTVRLLSLVFWVGSPLFPRGCSRPPGSGRKVVGVVWLRPRSTS
ncbi:MAG: CrcB family protein [Acidimicrobiia bacterium]